MYGSNSFRRQVNPENLHLHVHVIVIGTSLAIWSDWKIFLRLAYIPVCTGWPTVLTWCVRWSRLGKSLRESRYGDSSLFREHSLVNSAFDLMETARPSILPKKNLFAEIVYFLRVKDLVKFWSLQPYLIHFSHYPHRSSYPKCRRGALLFHRSSSSMFLQFSSELWSFLRWAWRSGNTIFNFRVFAIIRCETWQRVGDLIIFPVRYFTEKIKLLRLTIHLKIHT